MMKAGLLSYCVLVCIEAVHGCNNQAQSASSTCMTALTSALHAGDVCGAWSTFECCVTDAYSAAGCDASQANGILVATRSSSPALANCASPTCSGGSSGQGSNIGDGASGNDDSQNAHNPSSASCDSTASQSAGEACLTQMIQGLAGGDACGAWDVFECCLKSGYATAGCDTSQANAMLSATRSTQPALSECASPICGGSSEPTEVTTVLMTQVRFPADFDPTTFDLDTYVTAVRTALGISTSPEAVLKMWEILVTYLVPAGSDMGALATAIATSNGIEEADVALATASRRLNLGRRLNGQVDAKIVVSDAVKAQEVKVNAANVGVLETALGGAVTVKPGSEPAVAAVIETVVRSDENKANNLQSLMSDAGAAVGGTITAEIATKSSEGGGNAESASVRSSSIMLATLMLLRLVM